MLIGERLRGGNVAFAADGLRGDTAGHRLGLEQRESGEVDAKNVVGGIANPRFGVDGAGEMIVQVRTFRHAAQKLV
jgi:hypothetical protein